MLANVRQTTIKPVIEAAVAKGALVNTAEYANYARLPAWGYRHKTVCDGRGEYARDEDGGGFCEVHVNTVPSQRLLEIDSGASGSMTVSRQAARSIMLLAGG